jgi:hypothetical protein
VFIHPAREDDVCERRVPSDEVVLCEWSARALRGHVGRRAVDADGDVQKAPPDELGRRGLRDPQRDVGLTLREIRVSEPPGDREIDLGVRVAERAEIRSEQRQEGGRHRDPERPRQLEIAPLDPALHERHQLLELLRGLERVLPGARELVAAGG